MKPGAWNRAASSTTRSMPIRRYWSWRRVTPWPTPGWPLCTSSGGRPAQRSWCMWRWPRCMWPWSDGRRRPRRMRKPRNWRPMTRRSTPRCATSTSSSADSAMRRRFRSGSTGRSAPRGGPRRRRLPPPREEPARGKPRPRSESLGQILLDEKMVSREQLDRAIQMQHRSGGHLGRILVEQGSLSEQQLAKVLSLQWGMPYVELSSLEIDSDVVKVVPQQLAHRHKVLAIEKTRKKLKLAIADPLNVVAFDDVRLVTGLEIEPVVAAEQDIMTAIGKHYAGGVNLEEAMRQAVTEDVEIPEEKGEEFSLEKLRTLTEEAPVVRLVNVIISQSISDGASDIHIETHRRSVQVRYRVDGLLHDVMTPPKAMQAAIVSRIKIMANLDIAERRLPQDGKIHVAIENKEFDLRVSTLPTVFGEKVVMRILDQSSTRLGLAKLGFTPATLEIWEAMSDKPYGMILVSGPTGSGKTT